jgi:glycerophosphoryl diester phosphodiesterase
LIKKSLALYLLSSLLVFANPLPIAHRGAAGYAPENTLASVRKAIKLGAKYIEIDVHMSRDGEVVAIHDNSVDRTSDGKGKVFDFSFAELQELDAGSWFSKRFKDEKIPSLKNVLMEIGNSGTLIIELKHGADRYPNIEKKISELIKKHGMQSRVIVKSFNTKILRTFKELAPELKRLYCTFGGTSWITLDNFLRFRDILSIEDISYLQVHKFFLSKKLVKRAHEKGIKVVVWDVHDKETMKEFKEMGVDFIETDFPNFVLEI